jgi:hypothetical protein
MGGSFRIVQHHIDLRKESLFGRTNHGSLGCVSPGCCSRAEGPIVRENELRRCGTSYHAKRLLLELVKEFIPEPDPICSSTVFDVKREHVAVAPRRVTVVECGMVGRAIQPAAGMSQRTAAACLLDEREQDTPEDEDVPQCPEFIVSGNHVRSFTRLS